jgi:hypothetical protein
MAKPIKTYSPIEYAKRIRETTSPRKAVNVLLEFGEVYRKAYTAAKSRAYLNKPGNREKMHNWYKKYWDTNRESLNSKRRKSQ